MCSRQIRRFRRRFEVRPIIYYIRADHCRAKLCWTRRRGKQDEDIFATDVQKGVRAFSLYLCGRLTRTGDIIAALCNYNGTGPLRLCIALRTWRLAKWQDIDSVAFWTAISRWTVDYVEGSVGSSRLGMAPKTSNVGTIPSGHTESLTDFTAVWNGVFLSMVRAYF